MATGMEALTEARAEGRATTAGASLWCVHTHSYFVPNRLTIPQKLSAAERKAEKRLVVREDLALRIQLGAVSSGVLVHQASRPQAESSSR